MSAKTIDLWEGNITVSHYYGLDKALYQKHNWQKNKLDFIKIKNFCASKDTTKNMKRHLQNGWKYFQIGLVSKMYKDLQFINKKINNPIKSWPKNYICEVIDVLINLMEGIVSQCILISNHHHRHFKYFKYLKFVFVD